MILPPHGSVPVLLLASGLAACQGPTFANPRRVFDAEGSTAVRDGGGGGGDLAGLDGPSGDATPDLPANHDAPQPPPGHDSGVGADPAQCNSCNPDQYCLNGQCTTNPALARPTLPACAAPPCINVYNNCPIPLWTHAVGTVPLDAGNVRRLNPGEQFQYAALPPFGGGRVYAYYKEPENKQDPIRLVSDCNQFVEMTVDSDTTGAWAQNYNISYVDYASLPVSMKGAGPGCAETRCGTRFSDWIAMLKQCPTDLRYQHETVAACTGSYNYCITRDASGAYDDTRRYCGKMRDAHGFSGSAIYGGTFPDHPATDVPFWDRIAAWNRGTVSGDANEDNYYQQEPYNHYARWIHQELGCRNVYAFSTDDHQDKAGFVRCISAQLDIVWCPYREQSDL